MNMVKTVMAGAVAMALVSFGANAAGAGVINFKGSVIDAPCGIAPESADQSVDFGQISKAALAAGGTTTQNLDIKLVNCDATAVGALTKGVSVTFSGTTVSGANTELATLGKTGTAIVISGQDGQDVAFGTKGTAIKISGDQTLRYTTLVKQATGGTLAEGDFTSIANFNLSYE